MAATLHRTAWNRAKMARVGVFTQLAGGGVVQNMVIPDTYSNVFVKTVPGVTIKRTTNGFMIIVK